MEINKRKKLFFRFLKENNIYDKFIYEFNSYAIKRKNWIGYNELSDNLNELIKICNIKDRNEIINAFDWTLTKEISFWEEICRAWNDVIKIEKRI